MRIFFLVVIIIHGAIHFLGYIKARNPGMLTQLTQPVSRAAGFAWLAAGCLFIAGGLLYLGRLEYWWIVAGPAVLLSQTLIFLSWKDAKLGTIGTVVVLIPLIIAIADALPGSFCNIYKQEALRGIRRLGHPAIVSVDDIRKLPLPVQNYLRYTGTVGNPRVQNFRATFTGKFRRSMESGWMDFTSRQYDFFDRLTRLFFIESSVLGIPIDGLHRYKDSSATMQIKVASLEKVVDAKGDTMTKSETVTMFNDMCIMAPATLIDSSIRWETIDSLTARGTFTNAGYTISAVLSFNTQGELVDFSSDDRSMSADGVTYENYRWTTPLRDYKDFDGRKVATKADLIWHMPNGKYVYGKFHLVDIEYNCTQFK